MSQEDPQSQPARRRRRPGRGSNRAQAQVVPDGYLVVGQIVAPHGIRGEVRVNLYTDFPEDRFAPEQILHMGQDLSPITVLTSRTHKGQLLVFFDGFEDRDQAETLRDEWLFVAEEDAQTLDDGIYYVHQLVGLAVYTEEGRHLGSLSDVLFTGANDVYVVTPAPGVNQEKEILLPAIAQVIQSVDLQNGRLNIYPMPGLLEE
jgi:16S rRNA processing protein RimM